MASIYNKILREEDLIDFQSTSTKARPHQHKNLVSLRKSTEASVKLLGESHPLSKELLYFLGCLPRGIKQIHLEQLFPTE